MKVSAICFGFILDAIFGDPDWLWHPIRGIGMLIKALEHLLRRIFPQTGRGELVAGAFLWFMVCGISFMTPWIILRFADRIHPALRYCIEVLFCYQILARRSLREESHKVYERLEARDLSGARRAVSRIVGRDTESLSLEGVAKAAVETVAENASDGVIAPMFYLFLGGAPLGFFYKAVNTLDSMVGYKNDKYLYFGRFSARMDDFFNYIPARLSALCMVVSAGIIGLDSQNAYRIWKRDRRCHASPNAAQTESAAAGALHVQLAGDAFYFGKQYAKPTIGEPNQPVTAEDIVRVNHLMTAASLLMLLLMLFIALAWTLIQ